MDTKDRELLELAARAAGAEGLSLWWPELPDDVWLETYTKEWNPLNDDGDALRLASLLRLQILPGKHQGDGCSINPTRHSTPGVTAFVESKDMAEQMRRAIVLTAAEIGRAM